MVDVSGLIASHDGVSTCRNGALFRAHQALLALM